MSFFQFKLYFLVIRSVFIPVVFLLIFVIPLNLIAGEAFGPSDIELKQLPGYCTDKLRGNNREKLLPIFGNDWVHLHHYCFALNFVKRANMEIRNEIKRKFHLKRAGDNFQYMIDATTPEFVLMPELYVKYGKLLEKQGHTTRAIDLYMRSIKFKPDYVKAYAALGDFFKVNGDIEQARKFLEMGLKQKPKSRSLKRRISRLSK